MRIFSPNNAEILTELAFTMRRLDYWLEKADKQRIATALVARFYGLTRSGGSNRWITRFGMIVYLTVRGDEKGRVWLHSGSPDEQSASIIAQVDAQGFLIERYNGNSQRFQDAVSRTHLKMQQTAGIHELAPVLAFLDSRPFEEREGFGKIVHPEESSGPWFESFDDTIWRDRNLEDLIEERLYRRAPDDDLDADGDAAAERDGGNGGRNGPPGGDDPADDGPPGGVGGTREVMENPTLFSVSQAVLSDLLENL
ncbi:hypothetical protein AB4851_00415 [Burkholderia sp. 22PA0099]|uniref:hypothetical protein n=1 Tax=Burkholderia sp. 22PA0099 TaxID=3237372 RepID=UPI0039C3B479